MSSMPLYTHNERGYGLGEEIANAVSHGLGALLSAAALVLLVVRALRGGARPSEVASYAVFGASLVLLFSMSTIYHSLRAPRAKRVFEVFDHASIYVLIAGTYTAFCAVALEGASARLLFGLVWGCALVGCALKIFFVDRFRLLSTIGYLVMGWLILPFLGEVRATLPPDSFRLLTAGGLAYSVGAIFYLMKRVPWSHPLWHLFVVAGAFCHVLSALVAIPL